MSEISIPDINSHGKDVRIVSIMVDELCTIHVGLVINRINEKYVHTVGKIRGTWIIWL